MSSKITARERRTSLSTVSTGGRQRSPRRPEGPGGAAVTTRLKPRVDVRPPEAEMLPQSETWRALPSASPPVDGRLRDTQVGGQVGDGEEVILRLVAGVFRRQVQGCLVGSCCPRHAAWVAQLQGLA